MATNFEEQVAALDEEKETVLSEVDEKYGGLIEQSDSMFREQIDAVQSYADKQSEIQQAQTDFAVQQMEQQKDQLEKDYTKEQSAAYVDFKKQTDAHGVNAEKIAAGGMWGSGYSESAQTAMYTEYQRRVATAKASFDQAVVEFDNAITQAKLQNNSALAEIAFNTLQKKLALEAQMFTNRNSLLDAQANARAQVESNYLDVWEQLNAEQFNMEDASSADEETGGTESAGGQPAGTSLEDQLIKLGMAGISPQELMRRIESGEIIMIDHGDGTYTLKKGTKKNTNAGSALKTDGVDLSNVSKPAASTAFVPTVAPGSDPAQAAGQVFGQWLGHILGI